MPNERIRVLDVGNCDPDHAAIRQMLATNFDVGVDRVMHVAEAVAALQHQAYALVLVNRLIFGDGSSGLPLIEVIRRDDRLRATPVMMVSNFAEAQDAAVRAGAQQGFGKAALEFPATIDLLSRYLPLRDGTP